MPRNQYPRASAVDSATSCADSEVAETYAVRPKRPPLPPPHVGQTSLPREKALLNSTVRLPVQNGRHASHLNKRGVKPTGKTSGRRPRCNEAEWQILAEAAVDLSEILLGNGIHKINSLQDRVRLAIRKAESIRNLIARHEFPRELPTSTLPKITPEALLRWLDGEFKDVVDAVFFVDSAEEFATLLQTFTQGIAGNFFGDEVRVTVKVKDSTRKKTQRSTSNEVMRKIEPAPGELVPQPPQRSAHAEEPVH